MSFLFPRQDRKNKLNDTQSQSGTKCAIDKAQGSNAPGFVNNAVEQSSQAEATEEVELLVTFPSVHHALKLERAMNAPSRRPECVGSLINLMPVPRRISSSCGLAARIRVRINPNAGTDEHDEACPGNLDVVCHAMIEEMQETGVEYHAIYRSQSDGGFQILMEHD